MLHGGQAPFQQVFLTHFLVLFGFASAGFLSSSARQWLPAEAVHSSRVLSQASASTAGLPHAPPNASNASAEASRWRRDEKAGFTSLPLREAASQGLAGFSVRTLSKPVGKARGSFIWLDPYCATRGWFRNWFYLQFQRFVGKQWRIIEALGREFHSTDPNYDPHIAWYEYYDWENEVPYDHLVDEAVAYVHGLIKREHGFVQDYGRIILAGYSQGANVALEAGLRFPHRLGLVFSERGILLPARRQNSSSLQTTSYFMTAGNQDYVYNSADVQQNCQQVHHGGAPSFFKLLGSLDHYTRSQRANELVLRSAEVVFDETLHELSELNGGAGCSVR